MAARYLMGLKPDVVSPSGVRPSVDVRGRVVFIKKFACYACHSVMSHGHAVGGLSGPDLKGVPERLNPDWIYAFYCAQCHGFEGRGDGPNATESQPADPRDHTSAYEKRKLTDAEIIDVIKDCGSATGKSTLMPPFINTLNEREVRELDLFLKSLCECKGGWSTFL